MANRLKILGLIALVLLAGCISKSRVAGGDNADQDSAVQQLQKGLSFMSAEKFKEAQSVFEKILVTTPATEFDFVVLYNLGSSREGLKDCRGAGDVYKQILRGSGKKFPRLEAMALMRLSYTYECLGHQDKVIVALLDAKNRSTQLPEDAVKAELPARLASAYAKLGNRNEAEKYFKQALSGVKFLQVKYRDSKVMADTLAENLYFMGRSNVSDSEFYKDPLAQMKGLQWSQLYLLQSAELGSNKWSSKSVDEIVGNYQKVLRWAESLPAPPEKDPHLKKKGLDESRADILKEALRSLRILRAQRLPSRQESLDVTRLFNSVDEQEKKVSGWLAELGPITDLTPESERRQGLKGEGRVQSSKKSPLEEEAENRQKMPMKKKGK